MNAILQQRRRRCIQHGTLLDAEGDCSLCAKAPTRPIVPNESIQGNLNNALQILRGTSGNRNRDEVATMVEAACERIVLALAQIESAPKTPTLYGVAVRAGIGRIHENWHPLCSDDPETPLSYPTRDEAERVAKRFTDSHASRHEYRVIVLSPEEVAPKVADVCEHRSSVTLEDTGTSVMDDHWTTYRQCSFCDAYFVRTQFDSNREDETRPMTAKEIERFSTEATR